MGLQSYMVYLTTVSHSVPIFREIHWGRVFIRCCKIWKCCTIQLPHSCFFSSSVHISDFSILYIHCFVYTVYDDVSGQQSSPGDSGQSAAHHHTNNTATETDTGWFSLMYATSCQKELKKLYYSNTIIYIFLSQRLPHFMEVFNKCTRNLEHNSVAVLITLHSLPSPVSFWCLIR